MATHLLGPSDVHVWYRVTTAVSDEATRAALALLSTEERTRCERFVRSQDRRDFAAAHSLIRTSLSLYEAPSPADWVFETEPGGKPRLTPHSVHPPLAFNLSHTRGLVACAIGRQGPIGVDVESIDASVNIHDIARENFSEAEVRQLEHCEGAEMRAARFIEFWTLKEAFVKATGVGIVNGLNHWGFDLTGESTILFSAPESTRADDWTFALFAPTPLTRMAVAIHTTNGGSRNIVARTAGNLENLSESAVLPCLRLSRVSQ